MENTAARRKARILIVDDHPLVCEGLTIWISRRHDMEVCGEADNEEAALAKVKKLEPDLVIVDLKLDRFTHADAGQMHLYLNYAREH